MLPHKHDDTDHTASKKTPNRSDCWTKKISHPKWLPSNLLLRDLEASWYLNRQQEFSSLWNRMFSNSGKRDTIFALPVTAHSGTPTANPPISEKYGRYNANVAQVRSVHDLSPTAWSIGCCSNCKVPRQYWSLFSVLWLTPSKYSMGVSRCILGTRQDQA